MTVSAQDGIDGCGPDEAARWPAVLQQREALIRIARPRTATVEDAEDVVQEAIIRAAESYRGDAEGLAPWLMRVTVRLCADTHRQRIREHRRWSRLPASLDAASFDERVCDQAEAAWAAQAMSRLPARQARALRLRAEGLSVLQVAGRLGVSYRTAESLLARARSTLKAVLASALGLVVVWWRWAAEAARLAPAYPAVAATTAATATATVMAVMVVIAPVPATVEPAPQHLRPSVLPVETTASASSGPSPFPVPSGSAPVSPHASVSPSPASALSASVPSASTTAASGSGESGDKDESQDKDESKDHGESKGKGKTNGKGKTKGKGKSKGKGKTNGKGESKGKGKPADKGKPAGGKPADGGKPSDGGKPGGPGSLTDRGKLPVAPQLSIPRTPGEAGGGPVAVPPMAVPSAAVPPNAPPPLPGKGMARAGPRGSESADQQPHRAQHAALGDGGGMPVQTKTPGPATTPVERHGLAAHNGGNAVM